MTTANNPYFDHSTGDKRLIPGDTARAGDVNALLDAVSAGFTKAMTDISLRLPLPEGTQTSIPLTPAARAARALVFGADGNLETWPAIDAVTIGQLFAAREESVQQASAANASANAAAGEVAKAAAEANKAQDWAIKTDDPVLGGEYSAKHHAQLAASAALAAAESAASIGAGPVVSVNGKTGIAVLSAADLGAEPTLTAATLAEMQSGEVTERRAVSPAGVRAAIEALAPIPPTPQAVTAALGGVSPTNKHALISFLDGGDYTLPDFTGVDGFSLASAANAVAVPAQVTTADGWKIATGFSAGATKIISAATAVTPHGTWINQLMTPPALATFGSAVYAAVGDEVCVLASAQLSATLVVFYYAVKPSGQNWSYNAVVAVNPVTGQVGAPVQLTTLMYGHRCAIYADTATTFLISRVTSAGSGSHYVCSIAGLAIAKSAEDTTGLVNPMVQLQPGVYLGASGTGAAIPWTVSGITMTLGTLASGAAGYNVRMVRLTNTTALLTYTTGGTTSSQTFVARVITVSGNVAVAGATTTGAGGAVHNSSCAFLLELVPGAKYLVGLQAGSVTSTLNCYVVDVSGAAVTIGSLFSLASFSAGSPYINPLVTTYASARPRLPSGLDVPQVRAVVVSATMVLVAENGKIFLLSVSGSTVTSPSSVSFTAVDLIYSRDEGQLYAMGASSFAKVTVSGTAVAISDTMAVTPNVIKSVDLNDKAIKVNGVWHIWTLPKMLCALPSNKWLGVNLGSPLFVTGELS